MKSESQIDDRRARSALEGARKQIDGAIREGLKQAVARRTLPRAKLLTRDERIKLALTAGATTRKAYLNLSLRRAPEGGLLEFGGTIREPIFPKRSWADGGVLKLPWGARRAVYKPRHYRGRHFMEHAVEETKSGVLGEAQDVLVRALERVGLEVS